MSEIPRHSRVLYSPADTHPPPVPPRWSRPSDTSSVASSRRPKTRFSIARTRLRRLRRWATKRLRSMTLFQKIAFTTLLLVSGTLAVLTLVLHTQILAAMLPISTKLRSWPAGWLAIFALCFLSAFPPMVGYSTSVILAGFVYGFPNGWFIVSSGTLVGSTTAFLCCRYLFKDFTRRLVATDKRFEALSLTLKHDGIKLLCAIRLCPLPYSISNGAVSTFPTVTPWAFAFATALATPKLLIHVWIGNRLAMLAAAEEKMDAKTKAMNYGSIAGGLLLGAITGWVIYKRTLKRAAQLEAEERERGGGDAEEEGLLAGEEDIFRDLNEDAEDLGILMGDEDSSDEDAGVEDGGEDGFQGRKRGRSINLVDQGDRGDTTTTTITGKKDSTAVA